MLCSLFENNPGVECRVFLITDGLSEVAREKLSRVTVAYRQRLDLRAIDPRILQGARVTHHVSVATYFRILIPRILPHDVDKVLFLDSDLIVRGSVAEFYEQPIDGSTHAAVENPLCRERADSLDIPGGSTYFNAGVLLLNVRRWREEHVSERVLDYINTNVDKLLWWDQDALNATLYGRWRRCRPTWNAQEAFFRNLSASELGVTEEELVEARSNPRIVHFTGSCKPWSYYSQHPFKADYYKYLARTPWRGFQPSDRPSARQRVTQLAAGVAPEFVKRGYRKLAAAFRPAATQAS